MCTLASVCLLEPIYILMQVYTADIHNYMSIAIKSAKETSIVTYSCRELSKADVEEGGMGIGLQVGRAGLGQRAGVAVAMGRKLGGWGGTIVYVYTGGY